MNTALEDKLILLCQLGASELPHSGTTLIAHLLGTYELLVGWGSRSAVCDAGLFHSVYGTESLGRNPATDEIRPLVRGVVGAEAERLAFLFAIQESGVHYEDALDALRSSGRDPAPTMAYRLRHRLDGLEIRVEYSTLCDLANICIANELEQFPRMPQFYDIAHRRFCVGLGPLILPGALAALTAAFGGAP